MNDTDDLFKYTLDVEKVDKTTLKVNSESDLFVDLDNEWHVSNVSFLLDDFTMQLISTSRCGFKSSTTQKGRKSLEKNRL